MASVPTLIPVYYFRQPVDVAATRLVTIRICWRKLSCRALSNARVLRLAPMDHARLSALLKEMAALPDFAGVAHPCATMCGPNGNTPLHLMALRGDREAVQLLLECGGDPNAVGDHGRTPLHDALSAQHLQVARMLVAAGGALDATDSNGVTPREMIKTVPLWEGES
jgi:hypothetical protein